MAAEILLHEHPLSPYAQKIRILLREKGLAFDYLTPDAIGSAGRPRKASSSASTACGSA